MCFLNSRKSHPLSQVTVRHGTSWHIISPFPPTFTVFSRFIVCATWISTWPPPWSPVRRTAGRKREANSMWGPRLRQLSWFITPKTMVYDTQRTMVDGVYKPINITGGPTLLVMRGMAQMSQINCGIISSHFV